MPQLCLWLSQNYKYHDFRECEAKALLELSGLPFYDYQTRPDRMILVKVSHSSLDEIVNTLNTRSICIKYIIETWATANSKSELRSKVMSAQDCSITPDQFRSLIQPSFAWLCDTAGRSSPIPERVEWMNEYTFLFNGDEIADLKNPGVTFALMEDFENKQYLFGRLIKARPTGEDHRLARLYSLSIRPVLGPTTLDNCLAFVLCNMAKIKQGTIVLDPFCGTGGLLIAASECGGICFGSDLDERVLYGWRIAYKNTKADSQSSHKNIFANFDHYKLPSPSVARMQVGVSAWREDQWVDVILTDPPYGIRASAEVSGVGSCGESFVVVRSHANELVTVFKELFEMGKKCLRSGGLLVSLVPVNDETKFSELDLVIQQAELRGFTSTTNPPPYQLLSGGLGRFALALQRT